MRGKRKDVRRIVRERHWGMPVGYDHDGAVSNAYAVAVCPTITFARRGGKVDSTSFSLLRRTNWRAASRPAKPAPRPAGGARA